MIRPGALRMGGHGPAGECDACGEVGCTIGRCINCGAALCVGEDHDDLCHADGLSRFDREEMLDDAIRDRVQDELLEGRDERDE